MPLAKATLTAKTRLTHDVEELTFKAESPLPFRAGQFITIKINDRMPPCFRAYSIASPPKNDNPEFEICLKCIPGGRGTQWLCSLEPSAEIEFLGPNGKFIFQAAPEKEVVFIATGTGIAPFKSMIEDELSQGNTQKMHLLFGVRHQEDIFYQEWAKEMAEKHGNFTYAITLSQGDPEKWDGHIGRVTDLLTETPLNANLTEAYICGLTPMIHDVTALLQQKGLREEAIHFEKYD